MTIGDEDKNFEIRVFGEDVEINYNIKGSDIEVNTQQIPNQGDEDDGSCDQPE